MLGHFPFPACSTEGGAVASQAQQLLLKLVPHKTTPRAAATSVFSYNIIINHQTIFRAISLLILQEVGKKNLNAWKLRRAAYEEAATELVSDKTSRALCVTDRELHPASMARFAAFDAGQCNTH